MRILIVNSKKSVSTSIEEALKETSDKITLSSTDSVDSAKKISKNEFFDVVIIDIELFGNDIKTVETIGKGKKIIVLADTQRATFRESLFAVEINLVDYIIKSDATFIEYLTKVVNRLIRNDFINLLFVGNNIVLRDRIEKILGIQNYHFLSSTNHVEALETLEKERVDLILCDYDILDEEGVFFVQVIREKYTMDKMPIVIMSNFNKDVNIERYLKAGANDYIHKPFSQEGLLCRLNLNIENKLLTKKSANCYLKDSATGLYSFEFFQESGKKMLNSARREDMAMSIAVLEIDNFHDIVDAIGYKSSEVIKHLSGVVSTSLRTSDIIGRYTGEKIIILMTNTPVKNAFHVIDRIRKNIKVLPYIMESSDEISYTISGGVAGMANSDLNTMIDRADEYLYRAKRYGMDRIEVLIEE